MAGAFPADPAARYAVRLFFSDYSSPAPGTRVFDVVVAHVLGLSDFDIVAAAAGQLVGVVRTFLVCPSPKLRHDAACPFTCMCKIASVATLSCLPSRKGLTTCRCGQMQMA